MKHKPMDFEELDKLFSYKHKTGNIRNKIDRGSYGRLKAGDIATSRHSQGYLELSVFYCKYLAHRVAWILYYGVDPGNKQIDHINHDRDDNRIENLRLVNNRENRLNNTRPKHNTSGVVGVSWNKRAGKWEAHIQENGKKSNLGLFDDKWDAICRRKSAERRLGYHPNHGK